MTVQRFGVLLAAGAVASATLLLGPGVTPASAHDALVSVTPADGGTLETAPEQVTLEYSGSPQALGTQVLVRGPGGEQVSEGAVELRGTRVDQPLAADLPDGSYTVEWRVTSSDGHSLSGSSTFAVAGPAGTATTPPDVASPAPTSPDQAAAAAAAAQDTGGPASPVAWTAGGAVLAAAGVLAVRNRRKQS